MCSRLQLLLLLTCLIHYLVVSVSSLPLAKRERGEYYYRRELFWIAVSVARLTFRLSCAASWLVASSSKAVSPNRMLFNLKQICE